jgi:hypothetical protein
VTRTWPVNGKFTNQQREVYEVVLEVQSKLIELCGNFPTLDSLFDSMCVLLGKGLQEIGVIPKILTGQALVKVSVDSFDRMETDKFDTVWKLIFMSKLTGGLSVLSAPRVALFGDGRPRHAPHHEEY